MIITIVGLGLIGGSFAKAIKTKTSHTVWGMDIDQTTVNFALAHGSIDAAITPEDLKKSDLTLVCLYPQATIDFILENADNFAPGSIVSDVCGIKAFIVNAVSEPLAKKNVVFLGTHPMAGREYSGFEYSTHELFENASFILTPTSKTTPEAVDCLSGLGKQLGFSIIVTDIETHDRMVSYTSQLAHVVSNAYIKSPSAKTHKGFSAGSFLDLTRIARLNEDMWSSLMMLNKDSLISELGIIISNLKEYEQAMKDNDIGKLKGLLKEGSDLKKSLS